MTFRTASEIIAAKGTLVVMEIGYMMREELIHE